MSAASRFTRQSTLLELSETGTGRLLRWLIARQVRSVATTKDEERMFAGAASYLTVEKLVRTSGGKLPWLVADSVLDLANGRPGNIVRRVLRRGTARGRQS